MRIDDYTGLNVTYPLKEEVVPACDELTEDAESAQAVNTIFFGRSVIGHNTDGIGARSALEQILGQPVALERIGVLGTGATARAILAQLRESDAYTFVWGRDAAKASAVAERLEARTWPSTAPEVIISTLPPQTKLPEELVHALLAADYVIDTNYGERSTLDHQVHREIIRGDLMLKAQARASFDFWLAHAQSAAEGFSTMPIVTLSLSKRRRAKSRRTVSVYRSATTRAPRSLVQPRPTNRGKVQKGKNAIVWA